MTRSAVVPAGTSYLYREHAFGSASPTFDLESPGNAADATRFLSDSQRQVTQTLASLPSRISTPWCGTPQVGSGRCTASSPGLINEQVHHGAEISLLRDLYRYRSTLTAARHSGTAAVPASEVGARSAA